jgi:hypothetical protein
VLMSGRILLKLRDEMKLCDNFNLKVLCNVMSELACATCIIFGVLLINMGVYTIYF